MDELNALQSDTICAISTPPGLGGIAVARLSGTKAFEVFTRIWKGAGVAGMRSHTAHLGYIRDTRGELLDQVVATIFRAPNSFTGEDVVEISVHGSTYIQKELIAALCANGARLAEPGEFTRRAFVAGKLDLAQAEAVADLIASRSRAAQRMAMTQMRGGISRRLENLRQKLIELGALLELELDFSEEDVEFVSRQQLADTAEEVRAEIKHLLESYSAGYAIKNGIPIAIVGATNVGKSSLLNALLDDDRAIVSDVHGTTRDVIEDTITIQNYQFRLCDTAGLRHTTDTTEQLGIQRSISTIQKALITLVLIDAADPKIPDTLAKTIGRTDGQVMYLINKTDLASPEHAIEVLQQSLDTPASPSGDIRPEQKDILLISAKKQQGIDSLKQRLTEIAESLAGEQSDILITNQRHATALAEALASCDRALAALRPTAAVSGFTSGSMASVDPYDSADRGSISDAVPDADAISDSDAPTGSDGVINPDTVPGTDAISDSDAPTGSDGVINPDTVPGTDAISDSDATTGSDGVIDPDTVLGTDAISGSHATTGPDAVINPDIVPGTVAISDSDATTGSDGVTTSGSIPGFLETPIPADLIAQDLRETITHLSTITGAITSDTLLHTIFSRFCVGK